MEDTKEISQALKNMQNRVIGLFRPRFYPNDQYIPVIADENGVLTCIEIGGLLGLSTLTIGIEAGRYVKFPIAKPAYDRVEPKPQTLSDMMKNPIEFNDWYRTNVFSGK